MEVVPNPTNPLSRLHVTSYPKRYMAFGLTDNIGEILSAQPGLSDGRINPSNLEKLVFPDGLTIPGDLLTFPDQASADRKIDEITEQAALYVQSTRVVNEYIHLVDAAEKYQKALQSLRKRVAGMEITIEQAYSEWQTLKHQGNVARKKSGLLHASEVEKSNIAFAQFERGVTEKLRQATDESRSGSLSGSRRQRFKLVAA